MIHTNIPPNIVNSRMLSRPPLQTIPTNSLQYNLSSTNIHTTQHSITSLEHNSQTTTSSNSKQYQNIPVPSTSSVRTNPYFTPKLQNPTNTNNIQTQTSHSNYHVKHPYTQPFTTIPNPTYINSSTSISERIKPFDGLDHKYTPEECSQHIEARVTFSLGLQLTNSHEDKIWHAQRMAFKQCSLTGTALRWYIRLNDTNKQEWSPFVHAFKRQFSSQKNAYYAQVEALTLVKKNNETVRHFALKVQQLVERSRCNENASTINLKCNENFTKGLPKNLKDIANKDK